MLPLSLLLLRLYSRSVRAFEIQVGASDEKKKVWELEEGLSQKRSRVSELVEVV